MTSFSIGQGATLPAFAVTLRDEFGDPVNLTTLGVSSVQIRVKRVGEESPLFTRAATITDATNGKVRYEWVSGDTDDAGEYEAVWITNLGQQYPGTGPLRFTIAENATASDDDPPTLVFCTAAQARALLGKDVSLTSLHLAQTVISMTTGVQPDATTDSPWDLADDQDQIGLRQATAFQAAWLEGQFDFLTRIAVTHESVDGESRTYAAGALELAPMARWALSNTRYVIGTHRTLDAPPASRPNSYLAGWIDMVDNNAGWKPLESW